MNKLTYLITVLILLLVSSQTKGQVLSQTYVDPCDGRTYTVTFTVPNQSLLVIIRGEAKVFTYQQASSGAIQAWATSVFSKPCATVTQTVTQTVVNTVTQAATQAASSVTSSVTSSITSPSPVATSSTSVSSQSSQSSSSSSSSSTGESTSSDTGSESSTETSSSESSSESSDNKESKKEDKGGSKKSSTFVPPVLTSNLMQTQMPNQTWTTAVSFGLSQSSLTGGDTYSLNITLWSNLQQFSYGYSKSTTVFDRKKTKLKYIQSVNLSIMKIYSTGLLMGGVSRVYVGTGKLQGMVGGFALNLMTMTMGKDLLNSTSLTLFGTKPYIIRKHTVSPLLALSFSPVNYNTSETQVVFDQNFSYIVGSNYDYTLSKKFKLNLGVNGIGSTVEGSPITLSFTLGSRFNF